ncbi:MAG: acylphosphatase [Bacteroidales bacterium]|nr:acylphosphatase [Bacteroidales bacterium]
MRYIIKVKGRVQGVGFRYSTVNAAKRNNISGIVKNLPNGSVYIEAEGELSNINEFISWCKTGNRFASVTDVEISEEDRSGHIGFKIV